MSEVRVIPAELDHFNNELIYFFPDQDWRPVEAAQQANLFKAQAQSQEISWFESLELC